MTGLDTSSAAYALPPRTPLERLTAESAAALAAATTDRTVELGFERWFWGEDVCALGMLRASTALGQPIPVALRDYYRRHALTPPTIEHVNNLAPGAVACLLFERTGDPALAHLADACLAWYENAPEATRDVRGALEHWPGGIWADTVYMAGSFLLAYGRVFDRPDLIAEALRQWLLHAEALTVDDSGLFVHGTHDGRAYPSFWGRANAWLALAGVDLVRHTPDDIEPALLRSVTSRVTAQLRALADRQPEHGVWDVLVDGHPETRGLLETSAAAGIGAAMLRFTRTVPAADPTCGIRTAGLRAVHGALAYLDDGRLTRVSAGTVLQIVPFGYSVIRDDRPQPWGQGLALEAIAAAVELVEEARPSVGEVRRF